MTAGAAAGRGDRRGRLGRGQPVVHLWAGMAVVFILALAPRLTYPLSRPVVWYNRSVAFWDALRDRDWGRTYQQYHPGVTTMWIAGAGLRVYAAVHGLSSSELFEAQSIQSGFSGQPHRAGVAALAAIIAGGIALSYALVVRLTDTRTGFIAGCLLALDPFHISESKVLHVDALLATFMLISVLFLLEFLRSGRLSSLVASGLFAGLAGLTKSTAGFLLPYTILTVGLTAGWGRLRSVARARQAAADSRTSLSLLAFGVRDLASWGAAAGITFFALWPAMWVRPWHTVSKVVGAAVMHVGRAHVNPNYFAGEVVYGDPGPLYYLATLGWKTTLITLPGLLLAAGLLIRRRKGNGEDWPFWMLFVYGTAFTVVMMIAEKKGLRYLLPVFPAVAVLSAWGFARGIQALSTSLPPRRIRWVSGVMAAALLGGQAVAVLRHSPYYETHHNLLLGGSRVALRVLPLGEQGEGLDLAARFLNTFPAAEVLAAGLQQRGARVFARNFVGHTREIDAPNVDYWVFQINPTQRQLNLERWERIWQECRSHEPLWSVAFDGVTYVWIYRAYPHDPEAIPIETRTDLRLGEQIVLVGYSLGLTASTREAQGGDVLNVELFWQSDGRIVSDYHVFVHVLDGDGGLATQHDGVPVNGTRPSWTWRDAEVVADLHLLELEGLPPGAYALEVGMYDFGTGERLAVTGGDVGSVLRDRVSLGDVLVAGP